VHTHHPTPKEPKPAKAVAPARQAATGTNRTPDAILAAARAEFARHGYSGARIEKIATRARCNIRMIYHHFGKKEALYRTVLDSAYVDIRNQEQQLHFEQLEPLDGMVRLLEFTFDHFGNNPDFVALVHNENIMRGKFALKSKTVTETASPLRAALETLLQRGAAQGLFPPDLDAIQVYVTIAALSWFHLSNVYTLSAMFGTDLADPEWRAARREHVRQVVMAFLTKQDKGRP
jgi:AcrR family transcriptional regulator